MNTVQIFFITAVLAVQGCCVANAQPVQVKKQPGDKLEEAAMRKLMEELVFVHGKADSAKETLLCFA